MQTYDTDGAAALLHVDRDTVLQLINAGELPAAKIGRNWVVTEEHLSEYLRCVIDKQTSARRDAVQQGGIPQRTRSEVSNTRRPRKRGEIPDLPDLP